MIRYGAVELQKTGCNILEVFYGYLQKSFNKTKPKKILTQILLKKIVQKFYILHQK